MISSLLPVVKMPTHTEWCYLKLKQQRRTFQQYIKFEMSFMG